MCGRAAHAILRPNLRWNVVLNGPVVLLSAINLTQIATHALGAVERQLVLSAASRWVEMARELRAASPCASMCLASQIIATAI